MEKAVQKYWETIEVLERELNKENREYMSKVKGYMLLSSIFLDSDELLTEQVYNMYLDVLEGQRNGLTAQEFLGDNPRAMADELLKGLPPLTVKKALNMGMMMVGIYLAFQFLVQFASEGQIDLNVSNILGILFTAIGLPILCFQIIKKSIYQTVKWKIWVSYLLFPILCLAGFGYSFWAFHHGELLHLSPVWSIVFALFIFLVTVHYRKDVLVRYVFLPVISLYFISGLVQVYVQSQEISGDFWNKWLPLGVTLAGGFLFLVGTLVLVLSKRKRRN